VDDLIHAVALAFNQVELPALARGSQAGGCRSSARPRG
jgi:hypothetical protein